MSAGRIRVEVVYALPDEQWQEEIELPADADIRQALDQSSLVRRFPEVDFDDMPVGVFGVLRERSWRLGDGDRVEIYRALHVSPAEARRLRAKANLRKNTG